MRFFVLLRFEIFVDSNLKRLGSLPDPTPKESESQSLCHLVVKPNYNLDVERKGSNAKLKCNQNKEPESSNSYNNSFICRNKTVSGGVGVEPSFEPSGRNGVEDRTPNFWVKEAKPRSHCGACARPNIWRSRYSFNLKKLPFWLVTLCSPYL
jgi:hypothetical protein